MTFITSDEQLGRVVRQHVTAAINETKDKPNPEKLYTIAETGKLLGKAYNTVCRMIVQKRIVATRDGKYISQREIDNYIGGTK